EKRGEHPVTSNRSCGDRLNKKRRENEDDLEEIKEGNEVFAFRSSGRMDSSSKSCSINMEQVKEIGELIGVSWVRAENEKTNEAASKLEKKDKEGETEIE
ncbi:hypothetical protein Tco_0380008, partial [Tanacetum coccineum]